MGRLDDNEDAVVVAVAEPVEGHRFRLRSLANYFDGGFPAAASFLFNAAFLALAFSGPT